MTQNLKDPLLYIGKHMTSVYMLELEFTGMTQNLKDPLLYIGKHMTSGYMLELEFLE
jgi:hypothetical protein